MKYYRIGIPDELVPDIMWNEDFEVEPERTCTFQWVEFPEGDEGWCCSNCWEIGYEIEIEPYYCPNCGAKVVSE